MNSVDVVIVGASYAGLSAGIMIARMQYRVVLIDSGERCNKMVTEFHNYLTHDGHHPGEVAELGKADLLRYENARIVHTTASSVTKADNELKFTVTTADQQTFECRRILFASGKKDVLPNIPGLNECWGFTIHHCPFCHGYEDRHKRIAFLGNSPAIVMFSSLLLRLTKTLTILTNGSACVLPEETKQAILRTPDASVEIIEAKIAAVEYDGHQVKCVLFADNAHAPVEIDTMYAHCPGIQQCVLPEQLGCEMISPGNLLKVDHTFQTTVPGVYAAGDNQEMVRQVAIAAGNGCAAGAWIAIDLATKEVMARK